MTLVFPWTVADSIVIGFTGTQKGQTPPQLDTVERLLRSVAAHSKLRRMRGWLLHGDCIGADAQTHEIAKRLGLLVGVFPPEDPSKRAWCEPDYIYDTLPYLVRDRLIGDNCQALLATPHNYTELFRGSGTWYTVRYTRKLRGSKGFKRVNVVYPDGRVERIQNT